LTKMKMLPSIKQQTLKDLIGHATGVNQDTEGFIRLAVCEGQFEPEAFPPINFRVVEGRVMEWTDVVKVEAVLEQVRVARLPHTLTVAVVVVKDEGEEDDRGQEKMYTIIGFAADREHNFKRMIAQQVEAIVASIDENEWYSGYEGYGAAGIVDGDDDDVIVTFK
jgi:hypothetical protein